MSLVEDFWAGSTSAIRRLLLDEAAGRIDGTAQFSFDVFEIVFDFSSETVLLVDVLDRSRAAKRVHLADFLDRAASFGDVLSPEDAGTTLQRKSPGLEAGPGGVIVEEASEGPKNRSAEMRTEWQLRCHSVGPASRGTQTVVGSIERGFIRPGDWFHDGCGRTGRILSVDSREVVSVQLEMSAPLSMPLVIRLWVPMAAGGRDDPLLHGPEWDKADWESDLWFDRSLPDITARFTGSRGWDDVHAMVLQTGLRWEYSKEGVVVEELPSANEVFGDINRTISLLKVWVGPLQFNAHYFDPHEIDFDIEIAVLGDRTRFGCLVAFMDWVAAVAGNEAVMEHEGLGGHQIRSASPSENSLAVVDALRLADHRNPTFGEYRGVVAPVGLLNEENVDSWHEQLGDADQISAVLSHVHMYDVFESVEDEVTLACLAQQIAEGWRLALAEQFPGRVVEVGVDGEPDEYGPTVWMRVRGQVTEPGLGCDGRSGLALS